MLYAGQHLACPELVNSHQHLFLPVNHIRPVEDHNEPGDGVGECQESLSYNSEDIRGPQQAALGRVAQDFIEVLYQVVFPIRLAPAK